LVIHVLTGIFFRAQKQKNRIPEDFFFYCVFRRNFSQERHFEGVAVLPVFCRYHRNFSQEFLWDYCGTGFLYLVRIPVFSPDSCSCQNVFWLLPANKIADKPTIGRCRGLKGGCHFVNTRDNPIKVGLGDGGGVREDARPWQNAWGGCRVFGSVDDINRLKLRERGMGPWP
jgi:hypothetical protein